MLKMIPLAVKGNNQTPLQTGLIHGSDGRPIQTCGNGQADVFGDTPLEMPKAVAICWCDCWPSNLRRRASLSLRMLILGAGIAILQKGLTLTQTK